MDWSSRFELVRANGHPDQLPFPSSPYQVWKHPCPRIFVFHSMWKSSSKDLCFPFLCHFLSLMLCQSVKCWRRHLTHWRGHFLNNGKDCTSPLMINKSSQWSWQSTPACPSLPGVISRGSGGSREWSSVPGQSPIQHTVLPYLKRWHSFSFPHPCTRLTSTWFTM